MEKEKTGNLRMSLFGFLDLDIEEMSLLKDEERSNKINYDILLNHIQVLNKAQKMLSYREIYQLKNINYYWQTTIEKKFIRLFKDLIYRKKNFEELLFLINIIDKMYPVSLKEYELNEEIYNKNYGISIKTEKDIFSNNENKIIDDEELFNSFNSFALFAEIPIYALQNLYIFIQKFKNIQEQNKQKELPLSDLFIPKLFNILTYDSDYKNNYQLNIVTSLLASDNVLENITKSKEYTNKLLSIIETIIKNQYEFIQLNFIHNLINKNIKLEVIEEILKYYTINYNILDFLYEVLEKYDFNSVEDIEFIKIILNKNYSKETAQLLFSKYNKDKNIETIKELVNYSENELIKRINIL